MCKTIEYDAYQYVTTEHQDMLNEIMKMNEKTRWELIPETTGIKVFPVHAIDLEPALRCTADAVVDQPELYALTMLDPDEPLNQKHAAVEALRKKIQHADPRDPATAKLRDTANQKDAEIEKIRDLIWDTDEAEGTSLMITTDQQSFLLRDCAMPSLYESAKVSGAALGRLQKKRRQEDLALVLNTCLSEARGGSTVCFRAGKCAAVLSDNYVVMDTMDVVRVAEKTISKNMGKMDFVGGLNTHYYTYMRYELPDKEDEFMKLYEEALMNTATSLRGISCMPAVAVSTSDTGYAAATIQPLIKRKTAGGTAYVHFTKPIKIEHRGASSGLEAFESAAEGIFAKFKQTMETIKNMANTKIYHPINAIRLMGKRVQLPAKYISRAMSIHMSLGTGACSMHDVYLSFIDALDDVDGVSKRLDLEETIARILSLNWTDYDLLDEAVS